MPADVAAAREFVRREARVVEQRLYASLFEQAPAAGVARALQAYRNDDGGFGHGLEPDKRCPESQPVDVGFALELLVLAGAPADEIVPGACDYLAGAADERGAVPLAFRSVLSYPHAEHWGGEWPYVPSLWATVAVASSLHALGHNHPWLDRATAFALAELARDPLDDAHAIRETMRFLEHVPHRHAAAELWPRVAASLTGAAHYLADASSEAYGVSPLDSAPRPDSPGRRLFDDEQVAAHLDRLERDQQPDGGWPLRWEPPSDASRLEWRGNRTVIALATLSAYGRI